MGLPKCHLQSDQHADDDDDDDEIAPDAKVSFSAFCGPPVKCLKSDNSGGPLKCPAPCFSFLGWLWFFKWLSAGFFFCRTPQISSFSLATFGGII